VTRGCNLCGSGVSRHVFTKRGWRLAVCAVCGLMRVEPMPSAEQIAKMYAPTAGYQLGRLRGPTRYTRWEAARSERLASITGPPPRPDARLLDVGCSTGDFLERARARGWRIDGIDRSPHLAAFAQVKRGLPVVQGSVEDVVPRFGRASFAAITLWDVIEHLPAPLDAMRDLHRALEPGGTLFVATPNLHGWVPRFHWSLVRPIAGVWPHPEPPLHLHQFSVATITRLFTAAGFERVRFLPDAIPLWYTSGFQGEPRLAQWLRGEPGVSGARAIYLTTLPVFLAAHLFGRGDSMVVCGSRPG